MRLLAAGRFHPATFNGDAALFEERLDYAAAVARGHVQAALSHLSELPAPDDTRGPAGEARDALAAAAEFVLQRRI